MYIIHKDLSFMVSFFYVNSYDHLLSLDYEYGNGALEYVKHS